MKYSEKQGQIIATAERLFSNKGFDGTSVRDIADEAGVNIAMISYYFGSKEKLMEALFERRSEDFNIQIESLLHNDDISPIKKMEELIDS
ncbi:MAG TPA: TetR family transcriptional regulator, partial [Segetibacter sp.]|nr:TetR family transcriptional regulator [Segetibacter sp.]